jgi:hypothetical protein
VATAIALRVALWFGAAGRQLAQASSSMPARVLNSQSSPIVEGAARQRVGRLSENAYGESKKRST